ncbi:hypothetical protein T492DRAFT_1093122 [Pavlovales sp. CCMP2436]|nr:hypothetical protein T492DRAFT_1093122 [Pavlovales sp. CCMP2436]|mmetsp:Transcript_35584/g.88756  ORF Transcript_35584/g.88756 Transcript_35584/m.88756 type:complete len:131 (-) Transcript_35584:328-720(-)
MPRVGTLVLALLALAGRGAGAAGAAVGRRPPWAARAAVAMMASSEPADMWIIQRARLQESYRSELLNRPRRYLPFLSARTWARAMWFTSREDWLGMVDRGEKRNPYLPGRPDEYYKDKGWVSWDDFVNDP